MAGTLRRGPIVGINVTPMVDVVLVLLVIMMVTATYIVAQSFNVELPKTASSDDSNPAPRGVTIEKGDKLSWNDAPLDEAALKLKLHEIGVADANADVVIRADRAVTHGTVMHVIDLAKLAGITKFSLDVERTN